MSEPFVVSVHIPKTAGTTVGEAFNRCFNRRVFFDYEGYAKPQVIDPEVKRNAAFVRSYFDVLHGHFFAAKYFDAFPSAKFVATLRHPVERVISQYLHELNEESSDSWYHGELVSGRMDVVDFAAQDGIGTAMSRHLAGRRLKDYDLLLISEKLEVSLNLFKARVRPIDLQAHFGRPIKLPRYNEATNRVKKIGFNDDIRKEIYNITKEDNEVYAEAMTIFQNLVLGLNF